MASLQKALGKNFLDEDYNIRLTQILPLLEQR